jgi:hypothetical protein
LPNNPTKIKPAPNDRPDQLRRIYLLADIRRNGITEMPLTKATRRMLSE